ncbi:type II toxin-antitoxin system Y4mF family antitoxin [Myxococcota bacterium]|nr:type II toxin-antitoxin system Y4mF family antitoxin [Myxococcota bacterium]
MSDRASALGHAVRARRLRLGLRQDELAELAGCSARFVHTVEAGKETLRLDKLLDLLAALGLGLVVRLGAAGLVAEPADRGGPTR